MRSIAGFKMHTCEEIILTQFDVLLIEDFGSSWFGLRRRTCGLEPVAAFETLPTNSWSRSVLYGSIVRCAGISGLFPG